MRNSLVISFLAFTERFQNSFCSKKLLEVQIGELPSDDELQFTYSSGDKKQSNERLNVTLRDLTKSERAQAKVSGGVFIDSVDPGPAFDAGLRKGDIILQINSQPIETLTALTEIVDALKPNTSVPVLIHRQGGPLFLAMKIPSDG